MRRNKEQITMLNARRTKNSQGLNEQQGDDFNVFRKQ